VAQNQTDLIIVAQLRDLVSNALRAMGTSMDKLGTDTAQLSEGMRGLQRAEEILTQGLGGTEAALAGTSAGISKVSAAASGLRGVLNEAWKETQATSTGLLSMTQSAESAVAGIESMKAAAKSGANAYIQMLEVVNGPGWAKMIQQEELAAQAAQFIGKERSQALLAIIREREENERATESLRKYTAEQEKAAAARSAAQASATATVLGPDLSRQAAEARALTEAERVLGTETFKTLQAQRAQYEAQQAASIATKELEAEQKALAASLRDPAVAQAEEQAKRLARAYEILGKETTDAILAKNADAEATRRQSAAEADLKARVEAASASLRTKAQQERLAAQQSVQSLLQGGVPRNQVLDGLQARFTAGELNRGETEALKQLRIEARLASRELGWMGERGVRASVELEQGFGKFTRQLRTGFGLLNTTAVKLIGGFIIINQLREAVTQSLEFSRAMSQVSSIVDSTDQEIRDLGGSVRELAIQFGTNEVDVARGLYFTLSSGIEDTRDAVEVLTQANKLSVAGFADVETVIDLLTSTINAYGFKVKDAGRINDIFFSAVKLGKAELPELAHNMGAVLPIASQMGVSLEEVTAAISALTLGGQNADEAVTSIRQLLINLLNPTSNAKQIISELEQKTADFGTGGLAAAVKTKGLVSVMQTLGRELGNNQLAMREIIPDARGMTAAFALSGNQLESFKRILGEIEKSAGSTDKAVNRVFASQSKRADIISAGIRQGFLDLGDAIVSALLPAKSEMDTIKSQAESVRATIAAWGPALGAAAKVLNFFAVGLSTIVSGTKAVYDQQASLVGRLRSLFADPGVETGQISEQASRRLEQSRRTLLEYQRSVAALSGDSGAEASLSKQIAERMDYAKVNLERTQVGLVALIKNLREQEAYRAQVGAAAVKTIDVGAIDENISRLKKRIEDIYSKRGTAAGFLGVSNEEVNAENERLWSLRDTIVSVHDAVKLLDTPISPEFRQALGEAVKPVADLDAAQNNFVLTQEEQQKAVEKAKAAMEEWGGIYITLADVSSRADEIMRQQANTPKKLAESFVDAEAATKQFTAALDKIKRDNQVAEFLDEATLARIKDKFPRSVESAIQAISRLKRDFSQFKAEQDEALASGKFGAYGFPEAQAEYDRVVSAAKASMDAQVEEAKRSLGLLKSSGVALSIVLPEIKLVGAAMIEYAKQQDRVKEGTQLLKQAQSSLIQTQEDKLKTDLREVQVAQNKADAAYANKTIAYAEYTQIKETLRLGESQIQQQLRLIEVERRRQTAKQSLGIFGAGVDVATEFAKNVFSTSSAFKALDDIAQVLGQRRLATARQEYDSLVLQYAEMRKILESEQLLGGKVADRANVLLGELETQRAIVLKEQERRAIIEDRELRNKERGAAGGLAESIARGTDELNQFYEVGLRLGDAGLGHLTDAFTDIITHAKSAKDAFKDFALSVLKDIAQLIARFMALQIASAAFGQQGPSFGGFLQSVLGSAAGGAAGGFTGGGSPSASNITGSYSKGGVFETRMIRRHALGGLPDVGSTPALFRMGNGQTGSAREGGIPEAIMPLQRMSNGELGVRAAGNGGGAPSYAVHLTINSSSGDAAGSALAIKKLIPQIEASIVSALSRGTNRSLVSAVRVAASSS